MVEVGDDSRRNEGTGKCFTMDESFLNDLLECSVCLEQLDSTSKVLPCQHTFCKRCLQEIVNSHKELRCPECRILVDAKIEELPCNILLVRLLEGIKNNVRPKRVSSVVESSVPRGSSRQADSPTNQTPPHPQLPQVPSSALSSSDLTTVPKQVLQPCPCAKALYPYEAKVPGDLTFKKGDIIILRKRVDQNWFYGELGEKSGFVPASFVQVVLPIGTHVPQCKALYDFQISNSEEKDCLTFGKGDILTVIRRIDDHWAEGKLREKIGIFPISFVEMNAAARAVMKLSVNSLPGSSNILPPPAPSNESRFVPVMPSAAISTGVSSTCQESSSPAISSPPLSVTAAASSSFSSSGVFTSPAHSISGSSSHHSQMTEGFASSVQEQSFGAAVPKQPAVPLFQSLALAGAHPDVAEEPQQQQQQPQQRECKPETSVSFRSRSTPSPGPVFTSVAVATPPVVSQRAESMSCPRTSPQSVVDTGPPYMSSGESSKVCQTPSRSGGNHPPTHVPVPSFYLALYSYRPQKDDELELRKGELYTVSEKCQDGWFKGTSLRTGHSGVFPGNYVQLAKSAVLQTHMMTSSANQTLSSSSTSPPASIPLMNQQRPPSVTESSHPHHPSSISFSSSAAPPPPLGCSSSINMNSSSNGSSGASVARAPASSPSPVSLSHPAVSDWAHSVAAIGAPVQRHSRPPTGISPNVYKPEMASKGLSCSQPRSPNLSPWATDFGPVPTASPLVTEFPASTTSSSPTRMLSYQSSSNNGGNSPLVGSGSHPESLTRYCVSQPSTPLMMPSAHMSSSSTNPFVATPGPSSAAGSCSSSSSSSPGMNPLSQARMEKHKEKKEKEIVSLMKRLTKRKSKSPPPSDFSCDNPTFVDSSAGGQSLATVHIRSTSCPSEALGSQGISHKKTSSFDSCGNNELPRSSSRPKQPAPLVRERFRCIVPYPPNSDYELELKVGDVVYVHKKRDDGWYKGTLQRTGKTGLFPSSFVEGF